MIKFLALLFSYAIFSFNVHAMEDPQEPFRSKRSLQNQDTLIISQQSLSKKYKITPRITDESSTHENSGQDRCYSFIFSNGAGERLRCSQSELKRLRTLQDIINDAQDSDEEFNQPGNLSSKIVTVLQGSFNLAYTTQENSDYSEIVRSYNEYINAHQLADNQIIELLAASDYLDYQLVKDACLTILAQKSIETSFIHPFGAISLWQISDELKEMLIKVIQTRLKIVLKTNDDHIITIDSALIKQSKTVSDLINFTNTEPILIPFSKELFENIQSLCIFIEQNNRSLEPHQLSRQIRATLYLNNNLNTLVQLLKLAYFLKCEYLQTILIPLVADFFIMCQTNVGQQLFGQIVHKLKIDTNLDILLTKFLISEHKFRWMNNFSNDYITIPRNPLKGAGACPFDPSAQENYFAVKTSDSIEIWNMQQLEKILSIPAVCKNNFDFNYDFSPHDNYFAVTYEDKVEVWSLKERTLLQSFPLIYRKQPDQHSQVYFSKNEKFIAYHNEFQLACVWNLESGECVFCRKTSGYTISAISNDSHLYALGDYKSNTITIFDLESKTIKYSLPQEEAVSLKFSADNTILHVELCGEEEYYGAYSSTQWNMESGKWIRKDQTQKRRADNNERKHYRADYNKENNQIIVTCNKDSKLICIITPSEPLSYYYSMSVSDAGYLAFKRDKCIELWDIWSCSCIQKFENLPSTPEEIQFSPQSKILTFVFDDYSYSYPLQEIEINLEAIFKFNNRNYQPSIE